MFFIETQVSDTGPLGLLLFRSLHLHGIAYGHSILTSGQRVLLCPLYTELLAGKQHRV